MYLSLMTTVRMGQSCCLFLQEKKKKPNNKLALPEMSYYLSQGEVDMNVRIF